MVPKKRLDQLIPLAMKLLADGTICLVEDNRISGTYHGYVSSFGAMMAMSSPLAAALMFEDKTSGKDRNTKEDSSAVPHAVLELMKADKRSAAHGSVLTELSEYVRPLGASLSRRHKQDLAVACVALKLAVRSYPKSN